MHRADRYLPADTAQGRTTGIETVNPPTAEFISHLAYTPVGQRLTDCTPAQWDAIEARAVACMRAQLIRYHRGGGMEQASDYDRARTAWALIVMNRERITRGGQD